MSNMDDFFADLEQRRQRKVSREEFKAFMMDYFDEKRKQSERHHQQADDFLDRIDTISNKKSAADEEINQLITEAMNARKARETRRQESEEANAAEADRQSQKTDDAKKKFFNSLE